ncbi:Imm6 family immunity protein [Variovorax sp. CF313]|uniref:Imm6 family immunity protein n=1 Tax=Variovorax sp. CF313 TaxID=1144315 RepID=UPI0012F7285F|nr:Imm6 family immunity protein [Variovorax sp. CF313]
MQSPHIEQLARSFVALGERSKASFCIWIAGQVRDALTPEEAQRVGISHVVATLQAWEAGSQATGDQLNELLMNANDEGLYAYLRRGPNETDTAIEAVGGSVCYIAWIAYTRAGEHLPDGIDQVNDDFITWIVQQAVECRAVTHEACLAVVHELASSK